MNSLLQLKYAVEVEKTGSISKAAENLFMNQPNLSKAIRELEDDVGIAIFDRTARGVVPTEKGREFLGYARSILSQVAEMEALYRPADDHRLKFDLCAPRAGYISRAFAAFTASLGPDADICFSYRESGPMRAIKSVSNEITRFGVVRYPLAYEPYFLGEFAERSLTYEVVRTFPRAVLIGRGHPLAGIEKIAAADLEPFTEILYGDWSVPSLPVSEARQLAQTQENKKTVSVFERASQMELLASIPGAYSLVPPEPQSVWNCFNLLQKPCDLPQNECRDVLIFRAGYRKTKQDRLFLEKLKESAAANDIL
ncbi:MAG TPA: LysR family transcriptional regulator [Eubacteriales bacterium]|nr:LysR family transcriptional regulator [Eubacteriales bacterium]